MKRFIFSIILVGFVFYISLIIYAENNKEGLVDLKITSMPTGWTTTSFTDKQGIVRSITISKYEKKKILLFTHSKITDPTITIDYTNLPPKDKIFTSLDLLKTKLELTKKQYADFRLVKPIEKVKINDIIWVTAEYLMNFKEKGKYVLYQEISYMTIVFNKLFKITTIGLPSDIKSNRKEIEEIIYNIKIMS